jgi:electron transfer flavoprotein alpha/beta subunit
MTDEAIRTVATQPWTPPSRPSVTIWLGCAAPLRSIRWLDGALAIAVKLGAGTAIAAGDETWLDLANDRATRAGLACAGVSTDLQLDYLGWAQVATAATRSLGATTVLVDEASRPERAAEVAAIAELLDAAQLTRVCGLVQEGGVMTAQRIAGTQLQTLRVKGPIVIGLRIAGPAIAEYPTPMPSASMKRLDLPALGLDPVVLAHRALAPRSGTAPKGTVERVADQLAAHLAPRGSSQK